MTVIHSSDFGWLLSHEQYLNEIYLKSADFGIKVKPQIFQIHSPYKSHSRENKKTSKTQNEQCTNHKFREEVTHVELLFENCQAQIGSFFSCNKDGSGNSVALGTADLIYNLTENSPQSLVGGNEESLPVVVNLGDKKFIFPDHCSFFSKDVQEIEKNINDKYDLILLDPPWWNKYIRRKRKKASDGYNMMYNNDLKKIPIENLLKEDGLVVVWCTNSQQHLETLQRDIFDKWDVKFVAKWYWIKVTQSAQPVCIFADPPRKQPFEQILIGCKPSRTLPQPPTNKLIISVPSVLHSHKPPLTEVLRQYLPLQPQCLELFARYLLPGWSSYGLEVLKFQHESLYDISEKRN